MTKQVAPRFSPWTYRLCWLLIFAIHGLVIAYCCLMRWFYAFLPETYLDQTFQYIRLGLGTSNHPIIGRVHVVVMVPHALGIALMVLGSLKQRRLAYSLGFSSSSRGGKAHRTITGRMAAMVQARPTARHGKRIVGFLWFHLMSNDGIFGVGHKHFDDVLFGRELFETGFQTYQGYRMSWFLPRGRLNGSFVALLIVNCWSTALAQVVFRGNEAKKRLVCLLCDSLLDLVCSVGIPTIVFLSYWELYDPEIGGFAEDLWHNDTFLVQVVSELQMVVVSSWMDLASRVTFILGVYASLANIKELMRPVVTNKIQDLHTLGPQEAIITAASKPASVPKPGSKPSTTNTKPHDNLSKLHGFVFGIWGFAILVFHFHAASLAVAKNCLLQVRPWWIAHPACSLLVTHCHNAGISGYATELLDLWGEIEPSVVLRLVVLHCPAVVVPPYIQKFTHLTGIKLYNTTIVQWDTNAELNAACHKDLTFLHVARVNFSNGDLPMGLQARMFPPKLFDLEFSITNISRLPDDLDKSWHEASTIYVENSPLDEFPDVLVRLKPKHIGVGGNPIRILPPGAFESPHLVYMSIGGTLIQELPDNVTSLADSLHVIEVANTNISFWYAWIDVIVGRSMYYPVCAYETPYCKEVLEIRAKNRTSFSVTQSPSSHMKLSHRLMENVTIGSYYTYCGYVEYDYYPWRLDDANYGLAANKTQ